MFIQLPISYIQCKLVEQMLLSYLALRVLVRVPAKPDRSYFLTVLVCILPWGAGEGFGCDQEGWVEEKDPCYCFLCSNFQW